LKINKDDKILKNNEVTHRKFFWKDWIFSSIYWPIMIAQMVLVFFFYNYYQYKIISWFGWAVFVLFLIIGALPRIAFKKYGKVKEGKRFFESTKLVDKGIYGIIRHPYWLSWILLSFSLILISQYWIMVLLGVIACVLIYVETFHLDTNLIKKFGEDYRRYKKKVPRLNILYGFIKYFIRSNRSAN
jgi:protein-S-isoprenylcysteine O-methyltransferase Ste14